MNNKLSILEEDLKYLKLNKTYKLLEKLVNEMKIAKRSVKKQIKCINEGFENLGTNL